MAGCPRCLSLLLNVTLEGEAWGGGTSGEGEACGGGSQGWTWTVKRGRDAQQARGIPAAAEGAEQTGNRQDEKSETTERDEGQAEGNKRRRYRCGTACWERWWRRAAAHLKFISNKRS